MRTCCHPGCDREYRAKGHCATHLRHLAVYGETRDAPLRHGRLELWERWCAKVSKPNGEDGCWIWLGKPNANGYGRLNFGNGRGVWLAHRVAYFIAFQVDPGDLLVCHSCDNPPCVNPAHLFLGTQTMNMTDCAEKGRSRARLRPHQVRHLRGLHAAGETRASLARQYGLNSKTIDSIVKRKTYKHVA